MEYLFESPCWDAARGCVWYAKVYQGELWQFKDGVVNLKHKFDGFITSINLCKSSKLLITTKNQIITFEPETCSQSTLYEFNFFHPNDRLNDCKVSDCGTLIYSYFRDIKPRSLHGSVGVYSKQFGAVEVLKNQFFVPNGIVSNSEAKIFWISDTGSSTIFQFPYEVIKGYKLEGKVTPRRVIDVPRSYGRPDGGSLDISGNYWVALLDYGMIGCWSPDGRLLKLINTKSKNPTMITFWGEGLALALVTKRILAADVENPIGVESFLPMFRGRLGNFFEDMQ